MACKCIKKETLAQVLTCEFCEISKNTFFAEHLATASDNNIKTVLFSEKREKTFTVTDENIK